MTGSEPEVGFDLEALQAQMDLTMAVTNELVASWVPRAFRQGANGKMHTPEIAAREAEKELQELVRRPPRCVFSLIRSYKIMFV